MRTIVVALIAVILCSCGPKKTSQFYYEPQDIVTGRNLRLCKDILVRTPPSDPDYGDEIELCMKQRGYTYTGPDAYVPKKWFPNNDMGWGQQKQ